MSGVAEAHALLCIIVITEFVNGRSGQIVSHRAIPQFVVPGLWDKQSDIVARGAAIKDD